MYTTIAITSLFAALVAAVPSNLATRDTYYGVSLKCIYSTPASPRTGSPVPVEINTLTPLNGASCYELDFDGSASNVDVNKVECRAFKDAAGVIPASSNPFTLASPDVFATPGNEVEIGSVLCYVTQPAHMM